MPKFSITKKALADAFKELVSERGAGKITVGDICKRCGMSRKGFYYHFDDKYDLINWIFYSECISPGLKKEYNTIWEFLLCVCEYLSENLSFYIDIMALGSDCGFESYFGDELESVAMGYLKETFDDEYSDDFYAVFYADAFKCAIIKWMKNGVKITPIKFVAMLYDATFEIAQKAAKRKIVDENLTI